MSRRPKKGWSSPIPEADDLKAILRLMGRSTPREIVRVLARQPSDVKTLAKALKSPESTIRANVNRLSQGKIIDTFQTKPRCVYQLSKGVKVDDGSKMLGTSIKTPMGSSISFRIRQIKK